MMPTVVIRPDAHVLARPMTTDPQPLTTGSSSGSSTTSRDAVGSVRVIVPVRCRQQGMGACRWTRRPTRPVRAGGGVEVLQPHPAASHRLATLGAGDHDLPQLLGAARLDRLGHHLPAPHPLGTQEVGHVGHAHGELPAVLDRLVGPGGGNGLDDRGEPPAMDQAPWLVVVGPTSNQPVTRSASSWSRCSPSRRMNALWPSSSAVGCRCRHRAPPDLLPVQGPHLPPMPPSLGERA